MTDVNSDGTHIIDDLAADDASTRLKAALAIGSDPDPALVDTLVARCAIERDFYVRDMLTWALTRLPPEVVVPRLLMEMEVAQARSQALHALSKIHGPNTGSAITTALLHDADAAFALDINEARRVFALSKQR